MRVRAQSWRAPGMILAGVFLAALGAIPGHATPPNVITKAEYADPTSRYGHDVLGENAEWGRLRLTVDICMGCQGTDIREFNITLPENRVFEDIAPRLVDLDDDESPEVIVIESDSRLGSRLAVYYEGGLISATPFIGTAYRWLAPLGAADLDGDGIIELAYIDRPHLAKTLRVWRFEDRKLVEVASTPGLTNHRIGQDFISGGIRDCGSGPEIITADSGWRRIMATRLVDETLSTRDIGAFSGLLSLSAALDCK